MLISVVKEAKTPHLPHGAWFFWFLLVTLNLPCMCRDAVFKVGVVGPWSCDPLFAKAMPRVAAQLAVERVNRDPTLSLGTTFDYVILDEDCQTSMALKGFMGYYTRASAFVGPLNPGYCEAASLLTKNWNKALFSWACVNYELENTWRYPTFVRTMPSPVWVLLTISRHFRWANMAIVASAEDMWVDTANKVADGLRNHGFPVRMVLSTSNDPASVRHTLAKIRKMEDLRMVILCMHSVLVGGITQRLVLETALDMHLAGGSVVFVPYDTLLYSLPYKNVNYPVLHSNSKLRRAYDAVLTISMDSSENSFYRAYQEAVKTTGLPDSVKPYQVSPLFGTIYTSIIFIANTLQNVRDSATWLSGAGLARNTGNMVFQGFSQRIRTNDSGASLIDFVVLDTDGHSWELYPTYTVDLQANMVRYLGRPIHFPGGAQPKADSGCWFTSVGALCTRGVEPLLLFQVFMSALLVTFLITCLGYFIRRHFIQSQKVKGPDKVLLTLDDVTFIIPSLSHKKVSFDDSKTEVRHVSGADSIMKSTISVSSAITPTYENSNVVIYEGDWAWLKKLPSGNFGVINPKTNDVFELMKDMRHENMNSFLGCVYDCGVFALVTEFCSRGSLEDLLQSEDVKLDWMFKSSLLMDLIKGMKYLHHRDVCHGRLKSRNCVVDGRFVLKITDYCYNQVLDTQKFPSMDPPAEELLWTAPEILRGPNPIRGGSQEGDVYSFSIIVQEVVLRGPPFYMLNLPAHEIIQKIKNPPPLCRPVVSLDHAPMECIQLVRQCWNEQPDKRPNFDDIYEQFRNINKGKKTNIIDSMLRMLEQYSSNLEELIRERTEELEIEKQKTEKLLTQMLPPSVAEALKLGSTVEPEYFDGVTLYFSDIVGFTTISANSEPIEVVDLLNDLYTLFDAIIGNHDVYKVETIGDAYMVASGLPVPNGNRHAAEIANMALDILSAVGTFKMRHMPDVPVRIRIGLHTGPCVAGVVGLTMPRYCLFGDTVNTASRMESTGMPYRIHVGHSTVKILLELKEGYKVELRGKTELKGKGMEETYWLVGKEGFTKPLPIPPNLKSGPEVHKDFKRLLKKVVRKLSTARHVAQLSLIECNEENVLIHHH
ncbi:retinal guanylyl cyclase 2-like isoform X1 [Myxocyprinus asiaticus]|uniref:retinal guanylyl cyclase 2-like isoform X1 n=1 Tax=Myxocyprinus asiaticus TaxID=70543 RepID=UPI0022231A92|nr:retinal guanylyl cyclase 2-like isoform X1 [Myxocyprinus asiaticus]